MQAYALGPDDWTSTAPGIGGLENIFKAESAQTGGALSVMMQVVRPGQGPPLHTHHREDEAWFVLDGAATFRLGEDDIDVDDGWFVFGPRGVPHSFTARSPRATLLAIVVPGGAETFFHELALAGPAAIPELARKHHVDIVGPPPW